MPIQLWLISTTNLGNPGKVTLNAVLEVNESLTYSSYQGLGIYVEEATDKF